MTTAKITIKSHQLRIAALRKALADKYGDQYHVTVHDEVFVYSVMPNRNIKGWWLMGDLAQAEALMGIDR